MTAICRAGILGRSRLVIAMSCDQWEFNPDLGNVRNKYLEFLNITSGVINQPSYIFPKFLIRNRIGVSTILSDAC